MKTLVQCAVISLVLPIFSSADAADPGGGSTNPSREVRSTVLTNSSGKVVVRQSFAPDRSSWKELTQTLPVLNYDNIPLGDVVASLRDRFGSECDVVLPAMVSAPPLADAGGFGGGGGGGGGSGIPPAAEAIDVPAVPVTLRLQNVRPSEIFNAMNLFFTANALPLKWELTMNGKRPTAVLRPVALATLQPASVTPQPTKRTVFFVGDFVGDEKTGRMNWNQFISVVDDIMRRTFEEPLPETAIHTQAGLVVVSGTEDQLEFVRNLLEALKEKVKLEAEHLTQSAPGQATPQRPEAKKD